MREREQLKSGKGEASLKTRCDCSQISVGRLIHMLSHQLKRQKPLEEDIMGLTTMQSHVLRFLLLGSVNRDLYQKDVEEEFEIRKPTATGILQLLEKNGFIVREAVAQDARLKRIVPTEKAEALRGRIQENIQKAELELTEGIDPEELEACRKTLWKLFLNTKKLCQAEKDEIRRRT
ncbi:MAG: MarR family transcriptional regulator [Eubacteriales bacterium]|nr:MarR family transcriptional regulator [Eubacteriales bacterium]